MSLWNVQCTRPSPVSMRVFANNRMQHIKTDGHFKIGLRRLSAPPTPKISLSRLIVSGFVVAVTSLGCALANEQTPSSTREISQVYDTHATYDTTVEQYRRDYQKWLIERRAVYRTWRTTIHDPALKSISETKWEEFKSTVKSECENRPDDSSKTYSACRSSQLDEFLSNVFDSYESLADYEERHGAGLQPEYPTYNLAPSPPSEHDIGYAGAKRACAEKGGTWTTFFHWDGWDDFGNTMRCRRENVYELDPRPDPDDPIWDSLLPYDISVEYDRRSKKLLKFSKHEPSTWLDH